MNKNYNIIVIGLGIMGTAALWRAALKCERVLGLEASGPTHCYGSSQGSSRIFRRAYWEGEKFLPLLNHADLLWNELQKATGKHLLFCTGGIFVGAQSSRVIGGSIETSIRGGIKHEIWSPSKIRQRFPAFEVPDSMQAVYEPGAYAISASEARLSMLNEAVRFGAVTVFGDSVIDLKNRRDGVLVTTKNGHSYLAKSVIVTTGPWIAINLMPELKSHLEPRQVPIYWFKPKVQYEKLFSPEHFPVFLYEHKNESLLYGVPSICSNEPGVKIGFHNRQQTSNAPDWSVTPVKKSHSAEISSIIESIFPKLAPSPIQTKHCFYTMSTDESFLIGESTIFKSTYFASACSGHGFKFAPAIGDALANLAIGKQVDFSLSAFSVDRFKIV